MPLATLANDDFRVEVLPEAGASVVSCQIRCRAGWVPLMRPTPPAALAERRSSAMASYLLVPYSNRIKDATFTFRGRTYRLRPDTSDGHAIHGDVRRRPWDVVAQDGAEIRLHLDARRLPDLNFPFAFTSTVHYALRGDCFDSELAVTNVASEPMPAGLGFHPYFNRTLVAGDEVTLEARVDGVYAALVPTAPAEPLPPAYDFSQGRGIGDLALDHCFAGWAGSARLRWPRAGVEVVVKGSPVLTHLVIYTPAGEPFFAVEPVSHANNGFNLFAAGHPGTGVRVLGPAETLMATVRLRATPVR
jgi:aldose 1-epimerase